MSDPDGLDDFLKTFKLFALPLGVPYLFLPQASPPPPLPLDPASRKYSPAGIFAVSVIELERRGQLTDRDVRYLSSRKAQTDLKAGYGDCPALKKDSRRESDFKRKGMRRYQDPTKIVLVHGGTRYRITTEVHDASGGSTPVFDWAVGRGLSNEDILALCEQYAIRTRRKKAT